MPEVSGLDGIRIILDYNDHLPPHFHAEEGEQEELIDIATSRPTGAPFPALPTAPSSSGPKSTRAP